MLRRLVPVIFVLDAPSNLTHNFTHWEWTWSHAGETALNAIGLFPMIGVVKNLKYADETGALLKNADEMGSLAKNADRVQEALKLLDKGEHLKYTDELGNVLSIRKVDNGFEILDSTGTVLRKTDNLDEVADAVEALYKGAGNFKNDAQNKINDIRNQMPNNDLKKRGNMATAEVKVDGLKDEYVAHSKIDSASDKGADVADFSMKKSESDRLFKTYEPASSSLDKPKFDRFHDTEAKILEDIASQIKDPNVSGTINLYTEYDACQSCTNIIFEFRRMFPNIKLNIFSE